jgi:hypothetical protein
MRITLALFVSVLALIRIAQAGLVEPADRVPGHPGVTYYDLMKQVVTDLELNPQDTPTAHEVVPYRHIEGEKAKTVPASPLAIKYLEPLSIHADGAIRLALMADLGGSDGDVTEFVLLALFDMTGKPKLLDVVEVGRDRLTGFGTPALTTLGNGTDLINVDSDHFNSNEDFVFNELLFVRNGHFELIDSVFTFNVKICTFALTEDPSISTRLARGEHYRRIFLSIREQRKVTPDAASCDDKPPRSFVRNFHATYRWDRRRGQFVAVNSNLKKLEAENERLMNPP